MAPTRCQAPFRLLGLQGSEIWPLVGSSAQNATFLPPNTCCNGGECPVTPLNIGAAPNSELHGLLEDSEGNCTCHPAHVAGGAPSLPGHSPLKRLLSCFMLQMRKPSHRGREMTYPGHSATTGARAGAQVYDISPGQGAS